MRIKTLTDTRQEGKILKMHAWPSSIASLGSCYGGLWDITIIGKMVNFKK